MSASGGPTATPSSQAPVPGAVFASTGLKAAALGTATITPGATQTAYLSSVTISGSGSTAGGSVDVTIQGLSASFHLLVPVPVGAGVGMAPIVLNFNPPIPASAINTPISLSLTSFGAGNTQASGVITGFIQ